MMYSWYYLRAQVTPLSPLGCKRLNIKYPSYYRALKQHFPSYCSWELLHNGLLSIEMIIKPRRCMERPVFNCQMFPSQHLLLTAGAPVLWSVKPSGTVLFHWQRHLRRPSVSIRSLSTHGTHWIAGPKLNKSSTISQSHTYPRPTVKTEIHDFKRDGKITALAHLFLNATDAKTVKRWRATKKTLLKSKWLQMLTGSLWTCQKALWCILVTEHALVVPCFLCSHSWSHYWVGALSAADCVGRKELGVEPCELSRELMRVKKKMKISQ